MTPAAAPTSPAVSPRPSARVFIVMPAYNAARTLRRTYEELPHDIIDTVIVVDDGSGDETAQIARDLGLQVFVHNRNYGYGANQKTCYREALRAGADVIVMVHPDYQYDPTLVPEIIRPILDGSADVVLGSRLMGTNPVKQGMPWWKYIANRALTMLENTTFGLHLSEYHTGYRGYSRRALEAINFEMNADGFVFDQEILAQMVHVGHRIIEVPVPTRYFPEASSASFKQSTRYGLAILRVLLQYGLHEWGVVRQRRFDSLSRRYESREDAAAISGGAPPPRTDMPAGSSTSPLRRN
jgi:glycosyltransferase involved in cell wall biosynthesis